MRKVNCPGDLFESPDGTTYVAEAYEGEDCGKCVGGDVGSRKCLTLPYYCASDRIVWAQFESPLQTYSRIMNEDNA
jgi:hypothetical protein